MGARRSPIDTELATLRNLLLTLAPVLLLLAALGGNYLARRALGPVASMTAQARDMNASDLSERLRVEHPEDELGQLASTFNELFERIEGSFEQMRQFIADASHELRTPVTVIRRETDVALTEPREEAEAFTSLEVIRDEAVRLSRLVDDMFALARADADDRSLLPTENVYLRPLVDSCARAGETLGRSRDIQVTVLNDLPENATCIGDRTRLTQMVLNLIDNAAKYTQTGGAITIRAAAEDLDHQLIANISVIDNGPGVPEESRETIFDRFVRLDKARSRSQGGSGLGLPISRHIAEAHGGTIVLTDAPGGGANFTVTLPA